MPASIVAATVMQAIGDSLATGLGIMNAFMKKADPAVEHANTRSGGTRKGPIP